MRRATVLFIAFPILLSFSGCGLLIAGAIAGGVAAKRSSARKDAIKEMKGNNDLGDLALKSGKADAALKHYREAQLSLYRYYFKYERGKKISGLSAEYPEIARTALGLVKTHELLKQPTAAAAIAATMLPTTVADPMLRKMQMVNVASEQVSTAPHMYRGMRTTWHGEVAFARHDPRRDVTVINVVPYTFVRRQTGLRSQRYYDSQLRIYRHRLVPVFRTFKVPQRARAFTVELSGYNELLVPGAAATFVGRLGSAGYRVMLTDAVATKILRIPGGKAIWFLGVAVPV